MHHVLRHRLRSLGAHVSSLRAILSNLPRLGLFRVEKVEPPSPFGNPYHIRRRISSIRQAPAKIGTKPKEGRGSARIRESEPYKEPSLSRGEDSLEAHSTESKSRQHTRFPFRRNSLPPSNFSFPRPPSAHTPRFSFHTRLGPPRLLGGGGRLVGGGV